MKGNSALVIRRPRSFHTFDAFLNPNYRLLWAGNFFSYISRWMQMTILAWLVLDLTDSPWSVALVGFFAMAPMLVLGVFGGVLADRLNKKGLLVSTQAANLVAVIAMTLLLFTGVVEYWHAYVVVLISGTGWALDMPSRRSAVLDLLGRERITNASALDSIGMHSSRMLGPALAGVLISGIGVDGGYVVLTLFYVIAVALLFAMRLPVMTTSGGMRASDIMRNLFDGFKYVRSSNTIIAVILITIFMNLLLFPYMQMVPVISRDILDVGPTLMGLLMATEGFGALIGAISIASAGNLTRHGWVYFGGSMVGLLMLLLFSLSHWYGVSLVLLLFLGLGTAGFGTMQATIIMLVAREDMKGRALGVITLAIGAGPLGSLMLGAIADNIGVPLALRINAIAGIITIGLVGLLMPSLRARMLPERTKPEPQPDTPAEPFARKVGAAD